jgi:hypothetical protein
MAPQQYEILGENNVDGTSPAAPRDLFCWSNTDTRYGIYNYYYDSEEETQQYFQGDFTDWGTNEKLIAQLGSGWQTLSKAEWTYLLTERENADKLKSFATVAGVTGLILLPDEWTAETPAGTFTAEEWVTLETAGAVFLPTAGQMTAVYNPDTYGATTTYTSGAFYWTSSPVDPSTENALDFGSGLTFNETDATITNLSRRTYYAVRLVKCAEVTVTTAASGFTTLVSTEALDFTSDEGPTAYIATSVDNTENTITLKRIGVVPANTPIVLKGEPSTTYVVKTTATTATSPKENLLRGSATESIELEANTAYILADGKFQKNNAGTLPAGKAYLPADAVSASAQLLTIVFDDNGNTTAIKDVRGKTENVRSQEWYDLSGRKLNGMPTQKGIYIINGKKVVIK